jgi:hypothetical protein
MLSIRLCLMTSVCNWELTSTNFDRHTMPSSQRLALMNLTSVLELVALPLTNMATNAARRSFLISTFSICMPLTSVPIFSCLYLLRQDYSSTHLRLVHAKHLLLRHPQELDAMNCYAITVTMSSCCPHLKRR